MGTDVVPTVAGFREVDTHMVLDFNQKVVAVAIFRDLQAEAVTIRLVAFAARFMVDHVMSLKVIYFQSIFLIDFYIKRPIYMQESGINFTKLLYSRKFKRKQKLQ